MVMVFGGPEASTLSNSNCPQSSTLSLPPPVQFSRTNTALILKPAPEADEEAEAEASPPPPSDSLMYDALT